MDLWTLTQTRPALDPVELAQAIELQVREPECDYRTRLLVREASLALERFWGRDRFERWLEEVDGKVRAFVAEEFAEVGFPSLANRVQVTTKPDDIRSFLRELGGALRTSVRVIIGGSSSLILAGLIHRHTEDIDLVDEVPEPLRALRQQLQKLEAEYQLVLAHFQAHYLPERWESRVRSLGSFGKIEAFTVDPLDITIGKLMSRREKDRGDLRILARHFSRDELALRLVDCGAHFRDDSLRAAAQHNWYVLFGEDLPWSA